MKDASLLNRLSRLGLPLMETDEPFDVSETLAEVLKSKDTRLREGFPVVLQNAARNGSFDLDRVNSSLSASEKKRLRALLLLSFALYSHYHLSAPWMSRLKARLDSRDKTLLKQWRNSFVHNDPVQVDHERFDTERLKKTFELYLHHEAETARKKKDSYDELSLEYALSQVFSPKQKELLKKKFDGLPLTKTEREYFSRTVRKKLVALANTELHRMAQQLAQR